MIDWKKAAKYYRASLLTVIYLLESNDREFEEWFNADDDAQQLKIVKTKLSAAQDQVRELQSELVVLREQLTFHSRVL